MKVMSLILGVLVNVKKEDSFFNIPIMDTETTLLCFQLEPTIYELDCQLICERDKSILKQYVTMYNIQFFYWKRLHVYYTCNTNIYSYS